MTSTQFNRPLTKAQIEYASQRIHTIRNEKLIAYTASLPELPQPASTVPNYDSDQKIDFIRKGKATLKKDIWYRTDLVEAFTYPDPKRTAAEQKKQNAYDKAVKVKTAALDKFTAALDKKVTALEDKLHLGDAASTLALIEDFAAE